MSTSLSARPLLNVPDSVDPELDELSQSDREAILNLVVQKDPIYISDETYDPIYIPEETFYPTEGKEFPFPSVEHLPPRLHALVQLAYLQSNTFRFPTFCRLMVHLPDIRTRMGYLRSVMFDFDVKHHSFATLLRFLRSCEWLEELTIGIHERYMVYGMSSQIPRVREAPQHIPYKENLVILKYEGLRELRNARVPRVRFTKLMEKWKFGDFHMATSGPIPDGVLEDIAKEMMGAASPAPADNTRMKDDVSSDVATNMDSTRCPWLFSKLNTQEGTVMSPSKSTYSPFMNLPPELRNYIYRLTFQFAGPVSPKSRQGLLRNNTPIYKPNSMDASLYSSLPLLQTNKRIFKEAIGLYYSTDIFVFHSPYDCRAYFETRRPELKIFFNAVTIWYLCESQSDGEDFQAALIQMLELENLRLLEIILDLYTAERMLLQADVNSNISSCTRVLLSQLYRNGVDISFRCPEVRFSLWHEHDEGDEFEWNKLKAYGSSEEQHNLVSDLNELGQSLTHV